MKCAKLCKTVDAGQPNHISVSIMTAKTLTLSAVARYLGYSRRTLYHMLSDGRFPVKPIPGTNPRRWNVEDLDAWRSGTYNSSGDK